MQLVIMRHGMTEANERHEYAGKTDVPLTAEGERQARMAGVIASVACVCVSRLSRARRTAEICFPNAKLVEVDGLEELDFGAFEGRSPEQMRDDAAYRSWVDSCCTDPCPGGECRADLVRRVRAAVEEVVRQACDSGADRAVIVGHGGTVMAAMNAFADAQADYFSWRVGNCEGYRMEAVFEGDDLRFTDWERFHDLAFMRAAAPGAPGAAGASGTVGAPGDPNASEASGTVGAFPAQSFFSNRACKYFPCHEGVDADEFNCLFCYCPLYALGPDCGGNFTYNERGRKNCVACVLPHVRDNGVRLVASHFDQLAHLARFRE